MVDGLKNIFGDNICIAIFTIYRSLDTITNGRILSIFHSNNLLELINTYEKAIVSNFELPFSIKICFSYRS